MIRAVAAGMVYAIFQDLPFQHKKKKSQQLVVIGVVKLKKIAILLQCYHKFAMVL